MKAIFCRLRYLLLMVSASAMICTTTYADKPYDTHKDSHKNFNIPTQSLTSALIQWQQQSQLKIIFDKKTLKQYRSNTVSGSYSTEQALQKILQGSAITYRTINSHTLAINDGSKPPPQQHNNNKATRLDSLHIVGSIPERYHATSASSVTGIEAELIDTPRSIQVINEQTLLDQQAQDLSEALRNVSGIQTRNISGGTTNAFVLRGIEVTNIYQDGVQVSQNSQRPPLSNIESVEVVKGANSLLVGQSQPGGVINIVTKKPKETARHSLHSTRDNFGRQELMLDTTGKLKHSDSLYYRLVTATEDSDSFRETDRPATIRRDLIAPSVTWKISPTDSLTASIEYTDSTIPFDEGTALVRDNSGNLNLADVDSSVRFGEDQDRNQSTQTKLQLKYEHLFASDWKLQSKFQYQQEDNNSRYNNPIGISLLDQGVIGANGELQRLPTFFDNEIERLLIDVHLNGYLELGSTEHEIIMGLDYNRRTFNVDRGFAMVEIVPGVLLPNVNYINIFNPVYNQANASPALTTFSHGDQSDEQIGLFIQDLITLNAQWKLLAGLRIDRFQRDSTDTFLFAGDGVSITPYSEPDRRDIGQEVKYESSPNIGLVFQPQAHISLFASYSESFQANNQAYNQTTLETSNIDPSEGEQYEVGIKGSLWEETLNINLAFFDLTRSNIRSGVDTNGDPVINGEESSKGVELDTNIQFLRGMNLIFNYAYSNSEISASSNTDRIGNTLRNVPKHNANLWLSYEFTQGTLQGLGLGAGASYISQRFIDANNSFELDSQNTFDASAFYYVPLSDQSQLRLQLGVKNISDEATYNPNSSGITIGVGQPRTAFASISLEFND